MGTQRILMCSQAFAAQVRNPTVDCFAAIHQTACRKQCCTMLPWTPRTAPGLRWMGAYHGEVQRSTAKIHHQDVLLVRQVHTITESGGDRLVQCSKARNAQFAGDLFQFGAIRLVAFHRYRHRQVRDLALFAPPPQHTDKLLDPALVGSHVLAFVLRRYIQ